MNKAIVVIDMPEDCIECNFCVELSAHDRCAAAGKRIFTVEKPSWCPLKPMPKRMVCFGEEDDYMSGYNDCLEEIFKR